MAYIKNIFKYIAYSILFILISLCIYTFVMTDILKKDYVNVFGYTYFVVSTGSMSGTIEVNDIIFVKLTDDIMVNDIVTYKNSNGEIITHRFIQKVGDKYILQGDVNNVADNPVSKSSIIGKVNLIVSPGFILKSLAVFLILFIFLSLINFDKILEKYIIGNSDFDVNDDLGKEVPEEIFYSKKKYKEEKSTGLTVNIPIKDIERINEIHERENQEEEIEILELEEVIDLDSNNVITKEKNSAKEREKELLEQISNLLRLKNDSLSVAKINKKWLVKYQYIYKLANILLLNDTLSLEEAVSHPSFKEIYDYDLEKAGLYENLRNKIYEMPIYVFLRILAFAILYNDDEFFDGVFKIMKYKVQIDKNSYFKEVKKNNTHGKKQLKLLISFMKKISLKYDNKNVFELEKIEKLVKLKSYANN